MVVKEERWSCCLWIATIECCTVFFVLGRRRGRECRLLAAISHLGGFGRRRILANDSRGGYDDSYETEDVFEVDDENGLSRAVKWKRRRGGTTR